MELVYSTRFWAFRHYNSCRHVVSVDSKGRLKCSRVTDQSNN